MSPDDPRREFRFLVLLSQEELEAIDSFRFEHRMANRSAAVRELIKLGLASQRRKKPE